VKARQNKNRLLALPSVIEEMDDGHAGATLRRKVW